MHDFTLEDLKSITEDYRLSKLFDKSEIPNKIGEIIPAKYPNAIQNFCFNIATYADRIKDKIDDEELDCMFIFMRNSFIYMLYALDIANDTDKE